jgi:hypothetical protein
MGEHMKRIFNLVAFSCLCFAVLGADAASYPKPTVMQSVIESQVDGDFEGWEGETVVKLMNGQIWLQTEYHYEYHYAFMPDVLVYQTSSGWKMRVEGTRQAVGVTQLK